MSNTVSIQIQFGVPNNQRVTAATIFYESFQDKFGRVFGDRRKATQLLSRIIREDRILVALNDGQVVGFAGLHYQGKNFLECKFTEVARIYGLTAVRVMIYFLIAVLNELQPNQLHLEVLAVREHHRSKGIGTILLRSTIDFAQHKGFSQIQLEVVNTNPLAAKLYERIGFKKVKDRKIPYPFNILTGFNTITEMHYNLK